MKLWLEMLISCQMGGRDVDGRILKPKYENVFEVDVQQFEAELSSNTFSLSGSHRMVITSNDVKLFAVGSNHCLPIPISSIRGCSANRRIFKLEIGKSSESGSGILVMKCKDEEISKTIQQTMYACMRALIDSNPASSRRSRTSIPFNSNNIRTRTHSWSNVDKKPGSLGSAAKPIHHYHHHRQHSTALFDRYRTTSEGNTQDDLANKRSMRGGKSITSGSPMSPGSFVSSESAGSSNSLDETDDNRIVTPIDDLNLPPATIFEESSAESCVEIHQNHHSFNTSCSLKNLPPSESRLASSVSQPTSIASASAATPGGGQDINVNYTPIDIIPSTSEKITGTTNAQSLLASSPVGTSVHYSTILMDSEAATSAAASSVAATASAMSATAALKDENSYMIMSPPSSHNNNASTDKKSYSSNEPGCLIKHKPTSGLIADLEFEGDTTSASNVTSPNSQSSYNPLLDEVQTDDSSAYMVMSPATSSSGGGSRMNTAPRKISHQRNGSQPKSNQQDYVDMSPASRTGVPIPNRNERISSLSFGTSPSAALTSHLVSFGDPSASSVSKKTPTSSEESPYLIMSPVDPDKHGEFALHRSTPPIKHRTASIDSTGTAGSSSGTRPKTTRGRFGRGQSDSQRSSLCFDDHWDLGISPQDSSGGTLMGPPTEMGNEPLDYAPPMELARTSTISKAELDSLKPIAAISRLRLDNEEPLDLDIEDEVDEAHSTGNNHPTSSSTTIPNPRAYSVGCRPPTLLTGSSSSVSTTGSGSSHHHSRNKSRFIDIPGATTASGTSGTGTGSHSSSISPGTVMMTGQSPSSMAARLGSWIRHRTGSVPSKSAISGRKRHRTQSEGEKDDM